MEQGFDYTAEDVFSVFKAGWAGIQADVRHIEDERYSARMAKLRARLKAVKAEFQKIGE